GVDRYFVELFSDDVYTDCAFTGTAASGATGLVHVGKTVKVIADGSVLGDEVVTEYPGPTLDLDFAEPAYEAEGTAWTGTLYGVVFDRPSTTSWEVGLGFTVYAKTMPAEIQLQTGSRISFKKRIVEISAILEDTQELVLNDQPIAFRLLDNPLLDDPVPTFTGIKRVNGVLGYDREQAVEIEQRLPLKMTLLGLDYRIAVYSGT
ncbi:hypothetical protein EBT31_14450, partial [bacterium]|nr:hypothetical protein [bacterium]